MGLAVCWGTDATAFYVSLWTKNGSRQLDDTIDAPEDDENISRQVQVFSGNHRLFAERCWVQNDNL